MSQRERATPKADAGKPAVRPAGPSVGLVLGGGGARGLAHIVMLEALDELGIRPSVIAGTSIGAIFGAAYASGLSARDIRSHTEDLLGRRFGLLRDVVSARVRGSGRLWSMLTARRPLLSPSMLLDLVLPAGMPHDFADLAIPLKVVASDYYALAPRVFETGPLRQAVAASMALPVIFEPVVVGGRTLIDGGLTNPLPFDLIAGTTDVLIAVDVTGVTVPSAKGTSPSAIETLFASAFLFERSIVREKLKSGQPDIYIEAGTGRFQVLDFLKVGEVLAAAEPAKDKLKAQLERVLGAETLSVAPSGREAPALETVAPERISRSRRGARLLTQIKDRGRGKR